MTKVFSSFTNACWRDPQHSTRGPFPQEEGWDAAWVKKKSAPAQCLFFPSGFFSPFSLLAESIIKHILSSTVLLEIFHLAWASVGNEIFRGQNIVIKPRHIFC